MGATEVLRAHVGRSRDGDPFLRDGLWTDHLQCSVRRRDVGNTIMWHPHLLLLLLPLQIFSTVRALYEQCNHQVKLQSGQKLLINSPYYPALYPVGTSCRYAVEAPKDQMLQFKCELQLQTVGISSCEKILIFNIFF